MNPDPDLRRYLEANSLSADLRRYTAVSIYALAMVPLFPWFVVRLFADILRRSADLLDRGIDWVEDTRFMSWLDGRYVALAGFLKAWSRRG